MGEPLLTHQVIGLKGSFKVLMVDADRASHEHVLGSLSDLIIDSQKVGLLEGLEAEEVVVEITAVIDLCVDALVILSDNAIYVIREEGCWPANLVFEAVELLSHGFDAGACLVVEGLDSDSVGEFGVVWVDDGHVSACLCRQICDFLRGHACGSK